MQEMEDEREMFLVRRVGYRGIELGRGHQHVEKLGKGRGRKGGGEGAKGTSMAATRPSRAERPRFFPLLV